MKFEAYADLVNMGTHLDVAMLPQQISRKNPHQVETTGLDPSSQLRDMLKQEVCLLDLSSASALGFLATPRFTVVSLALAFSFPFPFLPFSLVPFTCPMFIGADVSGVVCRP